MSGKEREPRGTGLPRGTRRGAVPPSLGLNPNDPLGEPPKALRAGNGLKFWREFEVWTWLRQSDRLMVERVCRMLQREERMDYLMKAIRSGEEKGSEVHVLNAQMKLSAEINRLMEKLGGRPMERVTERPAGGKKTEADGILAEIGASGDG